MLVLGDESIVFNRLRAVFPMQVKPHFSITDFIGEYASSGFPRVDASGGITSANDDVENPDQGDLEFDPIARAIYPRAKFVFHDNDFVGNGVSGDTGKTGNALIVWHDGSADPSIAYGSVLPGSGATGSGGSVTGGAVVQGPFARTQIRAPGFTSTQLSIGQASGGALEDPYSTEYGKSLPVYGDFRMYGSIAGIGGCQGFTGFMRLFPPSDGALNPATDTTTTSGGSGSGSSSGSGSGSSSSSGTSGSGSSSGSGSGSGGSSTNITNYTGSRFFQVTTPQTFQGAAGGATLVSSGYYTGCCIEQSAYWIYGYSQFQSTLPYQEVGECIYRITRGVNCSGPPAYLFPYSVYNNCANRYEIHPQCWGPNGAPGGSPPGNSGGNGNGSNPFTTASGSPPPGAMQGGVGISTATSEVGEGEEGSSTVSSTSSGSFTASGTGTGTGTGTSSETDTATGTGTTTGTGTDGTGSGTDTSGGPPLLGGGLASHTMLAFRLVGSGRASMRWYAVLWEVGGMVTLCYNDANDGSGNPLDLGWVVAEKLKMGEGRESVLEPDSANTYVMGPTPDDWTIGYKGENFPGKITSGATAGGKTHTEEKLPKLHIIEVRVMGGQIRAHIGEEQTPLMWPVPETNEDGVPDWFVDRFMVTGGDVYGAEWSVHPTKFATSASLISNPINMGFVPDAGQLASLAYRTHYTPDFKSDAQVMDSAQIGFYPGGHAASVSTYDADGTEVRYKLDFANPASGKTYRGLPYAHATSAVRAVSLDVPGTEWSLINPPTVLGLNEDSPKKPMGIDVYHSFDLGTLSIQSSAVLTFNNFTGFWTNGEGSGYIDTRGHFGVGIELGTNGGQSLNREFTGIANTDFTNEWGGGGKDSVSISCRDCWAFLDVPVWNLQWMDGFNVYYAVAYLAELGTITRSQMAFADLIPDNPYGRSPGLPDEEQYFLPIGPAGTPVTRFGGGETLKNILLKISVSIGFSLFFDVFGELNFFKFRVAPPSGYTRTFSHIPGDAVNPDQPGTDEIWGGGCYRGGLSDTKNSVTVIGVNALGPAWNPIVSHYRDEDSIFDDSVANYKGYVDPLVWSDNLFADLNFADAGAKSMLNFLRLPDRQVNFSTWYPGGNPVYPGDLIRVYYPRSAASLHTYFVVSTHAARHQGQLPRLDIAARLIPI